VAAFPAGDDVVDADAPAPSEEEEPLRWASPVGEAVIGMGAVPMTTPARIVIEDGAPHEVLFEIAGEPAGVVMKRGRGAVVLLSSASPFQNTWLDAGLGGTLLYRLSDALAPGAPILFDEYHLGVGSSRSIVQYLRGLGAGPLMLQLLLVVALLLFRLGARFGRPALEAPPRAGGSLSYVEAVGGLYALTRDREGVLTILRRSALDRVAARLRTHAREPRAIDDEAGARLSERARAAILAFEPKEQPPKSDRALVERARAYDALVATATEEG
jgi:hypothetical protein